MSPSYSGQRNLAELALPDNVPVLTEASQHRDTASSLTDPQVCQFAVLVTFSLIHVIVYVYLAITVRYLHGSVYMCDLPIFS